MGPLGLRQGQAARSVAIAIPPKVNGRKSPLSDRDAAAWWRSEPLLPGKEEDRHCKTLVVKRLGRVGEKWKPHDNHAIAIN